MTKEKNIESMAADTVLQNAVTVSIGGRDYKVAPPTIGTLIMVSKEISRLPDFDVSMDDNIAVKSLSSARYCENIPKVIAIFILGAKVAKKAVNGVRDAVGPFRLFRWKRGENALDALAEEISDNASPRELMTAFMKILETMQVADFFALTASLSQVNMLKPTKTKTAGMTAFGQS